MPHFQLRSKSFILTAFLLISSSLFIAPFSFHLLSSPAQQASHQQRSAVSQNDYRKVSLAFEANAGQINSSVKFLSHANGYTLYLTATDPVLAFDNSDSQAALHIHLVGANPRPQVSALDELAGKTNYFIGNNPQSWHSNISTYARVLYQDVYRGVNVVYYGNQSSLEYDFVVRPGANPGAIQLTFEGANNVHIDAQGNLVLTLPGSELIQPKPFIYQEEGNNKVAISGSYIMLDAHTIGFSIGQYDAARPLIIDPVLTYSTYLGGNNTDQAYGIAVDSSGNAYVVGYTYSTNFPTQNAFQGKMKGTYTLFVSKLNASGNAFIYSTYLGGSGGDIGYGIAVDSAGNAYVTGGTSSSNFPTVHALQSHLNGDDDAFVTELNASGSALVYSTYLGGSSDDYGRSIAVDSAGNAYVTGYTESTDFPLVHPFQTQNHSGVYTGFVSKLKSGGSALNYSTYIGGNDYDQPAGIAVDSAGHAYITGTTGSGDFPVKNAIQKTDLHPGIGTGFISELNTKGNALVFSTFLGGSLLDEGNSIAVDRTGQIYVTGATESMDFPLKNPFQSKNLGGHETGFVSKLTADGSAFVYSTYLGGTGHESGNGITFDSAGDAYITGYTDSKDFPLMNPLQKQRAFADVFVSEFNASGSALIFSTYLGGSSYDDQGNSIAVDSAGSIYLTGYTQSKRFPTVNALQKKFGGGSYDAFVTKIAP